MNDSNDIAEVDARLQRSTPHEIVEYALSRYENIALSFSGAEDVVLVEMASKIKPGVKVFCLDTGRLHAETYRFIEEVRKTFDIDLTVLSPDAKAVEALVSKKGLFSFLEDGHHECCGIRKVDALRRHLSTLDAWITGQRKDQSPATRAGIPVIQADAARSRPGKGLVKLNPLANWSSAKVWSYIREQCIPYNALHDRGMVSIGCEPCTRSIGPGQHEREGRWWWEEATKKECGLHGSNTDP